MWMEDGLLTAYPKIRVNKFRFEGGTYNKEIETLPKIILKPRMKDT